MKESLGKILAWLLVGGSTVINIMLLWSVIQLPGLSGAGAAQADLGLYLVTRGFVFIFVVVLVVAGTVTWFVKDRGKGFGGVLRYHHGICSVAFVNGLIPLLILYWFASAWKH